VWDRPSLSFPDFGLKVFVFPSPYFAGLTESLQVLARATLLFRFSVAPPGLFDHWPPVTPLLQARPLGHGGWSVSGLGRDLLKEPFRTPFSRASLFPDGCGHLCFFSYTKRIYLRPPFWRRFFHSVTIIG